MLMRRRKFIVLLGGAAVAGPVAGWAQPGKVPRIGILVLGNPDPAPFLKEFQRRATRTGLRRRAERRVRIPHGDRDRHALFVAARRRAGRAQGRHHRRASRRPPRRRPNRRLLTSPCGGDSGDPVGTGLWPVWRGRAATSPGSPAQARSSEEKTSNSFARFCRRASGRRAGERAGSVSQAVRRKHSGCRPNPRHRNQAHPVRGAEEIRRGLCRDGRKWRAEAVIVQPSLPHGVSSKWR